MDALRSDKEPAQLYKEYRDMNNTDSTLNPSGMAQPSSNSNSTINTSQPGKPREESIPRMGRQDSISFYTNLGGQRFSTDSNSSISNYLSFGAPGSDPQQGQQGASFDVNGRGMSVINNLFGPPSTGGSQSSVPVIPQTTADYNGYSSLRRPSEQLEVFNPSVKLKMPSFSKKGSVAYPSGTNLADQVGNDFDLFGRKDSIRNYRQPSFLGNNMGDGTEFDFVNFNKRDSLKNMGDDELSFSAPATATGNDKRRETRSEPDVGNGKQEMKSIPEYEGGLEPKHEFRQPQMQQFDYHPIYSQEQIRPNTQEHEHRIPVSANPRIIKSSPAPTQKRKRRKATPAENRSTSPNSAAPVRRNAIQSATSPGSSQYATPSPSQLVPAQEGVVHEDGRPLLGATKVDQLMLVIQARKKGISDTITRGPDGAIVDEGNGVLPKQAELVGGIDKPKTKAAKHHECSYCHKTFTQSTHLEVHVRSHIGYKPYECQYCQKRFTQGGNLRTHLRLHTGEKPYVCETCGRQFSRKGNLAAHKLTHENLKPYECKLDNCNKAFTQLGNLKAHQNRFHLETLNELTRKLAELDLENTDMKQDERDLLNYFADLYKNSNRGIKGRGKKARLEKFDSEPPQSSGFINSRQQTYEPEQDHDHVLQQVPQGNSARSDFNFANQSYMPQDKNIEFKNVNYQQ